MPGSKRIWVQASGVAELACAGAADPAAHPPPRRLADLRARCSRVWTANIQVALDGGMKEQDPPFDSRRGRLDPPAVPAPDDLRRRTSRPLQLVEPVDAVPRTVMCGNARGSAAACGRLPRDAIHRQLGRRRELVRCTRSRSAKRTARSSIGCTTPARSRAPPRSPTTSRSRACVVDPTATRSSTRRRPHSRSRSPAGPTPRRT